MEMLMRQCKDEPGSDDILGHYDTRYFKGVVDYDVRTDTLHHLMRSYLLFFAEKGLETWIAHGTLLGWWWNGQVRNVSVMLLLSASSGSN